MKKIAKFLSIAILVLSTACSSSDDNNDQSQISSENSFTVTVDGVNYTFDTFFAFKTHDNYEVLGSNSNQENFYLRFNQNGVLDHANFYSTDFSLDLDFLSSFYNAKSMFTLSDLTFDSSQNIVNASFNGTLFEDDIDVTNSTTVEVQNGSFNLTYIVNEVDVNLDEHIDAAINGELYETVKHGRSGGAAGGTIYQLFGVSDNNIVISIDVDSNTVQEGTFTFASDDVVNRVSVETVNPFSITNDFEILSVTGTVTIDSIIDGAAFDLFQGSFSATATSEAGEVYVIENGIFNLSL